MQALVLVGGEGTRLRPLTAAMPKPVVPLVDRPLVSYLVDWLESHGVEEVVLACGFLPDALRDAIGEGEPGGPRLTWVAEPELRGTAGAIKFAEPHLGERFLALNGDVLSDLDLTSLVRFHEEAGARATLGLYPVDDAEGYGRVRREPDGQVVEFLEKPGDASATDSAEINAGAYVLEREVLDLIPPDRPVSIEREVFPRMAGDGLYGLRLEGYWIDVGTPERYLQATWDILEGRVATRVEPRADGVFLAPGAAVDEDATVGPRAVVSEACRVAGGAAVSESVLLAGCEVREGARVSGSILSPGVVVEPGASVDGDVVGANEKVRA
jgi:mannose-1-phosphate guanylyltransferase